MRASRALPRRMRAVVQGPPGELALEERPLREPAAGEVLVRVRASGVCGSDLHFWKHAIYGPGTILGHEIAGEVVAVGGGVDRVRVGERGAVYGAIACGRCVRCRAGLDDHCEGGLSLGTGGPFGGFAEYVIAPAANFLPAPADADPACLAFSEPLANGLRALDDPRAERAGSALVIGAGPIGLACLIVARELGIARVWVVEGRPRRREAARELGAERVLDPSAPLAEALGEAFPVGVDVAIEAVGKPETIRSALRAARPGGLVVLMGVCLEPVEVRPVTWLLRELTIRSPLGCSREQQRRALEWIASGRVDPGPLITRRVRLEQLPEAVAGLAAGADEIKVMMENG